MKVQPTVGALSALILASAFCTYRVGSQETSWSTHASSEQHRVTETPEQRLLREKYQNARRNAQESNYKAKLNNGSKRGGLTPDQLPEEVRAEAETIAQQYRDGLYPALKRYVDSHGGRLPSPAFAVPDIAPFMEDKEYKGTGPKSYGRGSWAVMGFGTRMDGTSVARDVYSGNPPDAPHDVWASYDNWRNFPSLGKGFSITGWDDGRVTFDPPEDNFYGTGKDLYGEPTERAAIPGQAGIPPEAKQSLKKWMKQQQDLLLREQAAKEKAAKEQVEKDKAAKDEAAKDDAPKNDTSKQ